MPDRPAKWDTYSGGNDALVPVDDDDEEDGLVPLDDDEEGDAVFLGDLRSRLDRKHKAEPESGSGRNPEKRSRVRGCICCSEFDHVLKDCKNFVAMSPNQRMELILETGATCINCLGLGHTVNKCKKKGECSVGDCSGKHHTFLHKATNFPAEKLQSARVCLCENEFQRKDPSLGKNVF
jgi:hypothetical protein